jgi:hypothetical protein
MTACEKDDDLNGLSLNFQGLESLGPDYLYEGWIIVDGDPVSTGTFSVDAQGNASTASFPVDQDELDKATAFVLTIEPSPDVDPAPSATHLMAGDFTGNAATLTIGHEAALGDDFKSSSGSYILATPTNGMSTDELSGVWWLDPSDGPSASLSLPVLPEGWIYEGWAVIDGIPVTTGKFLSTSGADSFNGYSSTQSAPPFPGEDFLINAPAGLTFPTNLRGMTVVVSIEPSPDNLAAPFSLKPLRANVPSGATDHSTLPMSNNSSTIPTGTAIK